MQETNLKGFAKFSPHGAIIVANWSVVRQKGRQKGRIKSGAAGQFSILQTNFGDFELKGSKRGQTLTLIRAAIKKCIEWRLQVQIAF